MSRPSRGRRAAACGRPGGAASPWRSGGRARPRWRPGAAAARRRRRPGRVGVEGDLAVDLDHVGPEVGRRRARAPASGALRRKRRFGGGVGSQSRRRRQTSSLTQAIWRPAVETASISASASANPSAAATWSWSWRRSLSCSRSAMRCSSTRMSVSSAVGALERGEVGVVGQQRRVGGDGAQHADVAQPAVALLQVGLEEEGDVAGGGASLGHLDLEQRAGTWCRAGRARRPWPSRGAARRPCGSPQTMRGVEQAERDAERPRRRR